VNEAEAKVVADKVNTLVQSSFYDGTFIAIEDLVGTGLTKSQSKNVAKKMVMTKILVCVDGKYTANPKLVEKMQNADASSV